MPEIVSPRLRRLYEYWDEKHGGRAMPSRADIDPVDMAFALGNVIPAEVLPETSPRFRIRLHGTARASLRPERLAELPDALMDLSR